MSLLCLLGCGGLQLTKVDSAHKRPSNVAVFFAVHDSNREPVPGLEARDFRIYEDDRLVSPHESKQTIVSQEVAAEHSTLLLVDMSGSVTESDQVPLIVDAATRFSGKVERHQRVAIYAFDGSEDIHRISGFRRSTAAAGRLEGFRARDPSTNLHGAVVQGLDTLDRQLQRGDTPLRFGTLVVFTDGTDRAHRVKYDEMMSAIDDSGLDIFAIGVGNEIDEGTLADIGRNGYVMVDDRDALSRAFQAIGKRITRYTKSFYLLSYCSPARAGTHRVTIEAMRDGASGELSYQFDAEGFGPHCNPEAPPPFKTRGRQNLPTPPKGTRIELSAEASAGGSP